MRNIVAIRIAVCIALAGLASVLPAAVLEVPADFTTIQAAINAAQDGDEILVSPGVYDESINFLGKAIKVRSSQGPDLTQISGTPGTRIVTFDSLETTDSVLEGFTIAPLSTTPVISQLDGSGIEIFNASPTIRENRIVDNTAGFLGAGMTIAGGAAVIENNEFVNNTFFQLAADIVFGDGGAIFIETGGPVIVRNNRFEDNGTGERGGAIATTSCDLILEDNVFVGNSAVNGGALSIGLASTLTARNNLFVSNRATGLGTLTGFLGGRGGAIHLDPQSLSEITLCTFVLNDAIGVGLTGFPAGTESFGGAVDFGGSTSDVSSSIFWNNVADQFPQFDDTTAVLTLNYCCVEGGYSSGTGNLDQDPLFVSIPTGDYFLSQTAAGQPSTSPCVDAGDPALILLGRTTRTDFVADAPPVDIGYHAFIGNLDLGFVRGDANLTGGVDIADAITSLTNLFQGGTTLCEDASDANDDGLINIADPIAVLNSLFVPGTTPLPEPTTCGTDPTPDALDCAQPLDCL